MPAIRSPLPSSPSRLRRCLESLVFGLLFLIALRTWWLEGLAIPYQVAGGSMAETVVGPHRAAVCGDCRFEFVCGVDANPGRRQTVCPSCGHLGDGGDVLEDLPGERLLIDKSVFSFRRPQRWEVVAFRPSHRAGQVQIKRVAGLPGESVQIVDGDLVVDKQIQRKTLMQQRALAVLVHDANYRPAIDPVPPPRWQGADKRSRWRSARGQVDSEAERASWYFAHPAGSDRDPIDWLEYGHWRRIAGRLEEGPVTDVCGYNQTQPRRKEEISPVTDLMLSFELVETFGDGMLAIRATDGEEEFRVRIYSDRNRYEVLHNGRPIPAAAGKLPAATDGLTVEVSLFDRQFLLAFDGRAAVTWPYHRRRNPAEPVTKPLAIGTQGRGVVIRDLKVHRDTYYTHPTGVQARWGIGQPVLLGSDEYYVLGDNSPISLDSRTWPKTAAVAANLLVGKPIVVHLPVKRVHVGGRRFKVPDPARIRYIR